LHSPSLSHPAASLSQLCCSCLTCPDTAHCTLHTTSCGLHRLCPACAAQVEATFSQPNAGMCEQMVAWAQRVTAGSYNPAPAAAAPPSIPVPAAAPVAADDGAAAATTTTAAGQDGGAGASQPAAAEAAAAPSPTPSASGSGQAVASGGGAGGCNPQGSHDLLELYCGNGNFTIPLASNFRCVVCKLRSTGRQARVGTVGCACTAFARVCLFVCAASREHKPDGSHKLFYQSTFLSRFCQGTSGPSTHSRCVSPCVLGASSFHLISVTDSPGYTCPAHET